MSKSDDKQSNVTYLPVPPDRGEPKPLPEGEQSAEVIPHPAELEHSVCRRPWPSMRTSSDEEDETPESD